MSDGGTPPGPADDNAPQDEATACAANSQDAPNAGEDATAPIGVSQSAAGGEDSLRSAAYALIRELGSSEAGRSLSALLAELRADYDVTTQRFGDRGRFRFAAMDHGRRLAGYAGAAAVAPRLDAAPPPEPQLHTSDAVGLRAPREHETGLPGLTAAEAGLLIGAQRQLWDLTQRAFAPLFFAFPGLAAILDPDTAPRWTGRRSALGESSLAAFPPPVARVGPGQAHAWLSDPPSTASAAVDPLTAPPDAPNLWPAVWSPATADLAVHALARHPGHQLLCALSTSPAVHALLADEPELLWRRMEALRLALLDAGARGIPEVWTRHMHLFETGPARDRFRAVAAAFALRRSLGVLHQLVYQRTLNVRPVLTDDLLVSLPKGAGWTVLSSGAVVRIIHPDGPRHAHGPWLVDETGECVGWATARDVIGHRPQYPTASGGAPLVELSFCGGGGGDYGEIYEFDVRQIDQWLNPIPGLVLDPLTRDV